MTGSWKPPGLRRRQLPGLHALTPYQSSRYPRASQPVGSRFSPICSNTQARSGPRTSSVL
jgi:hypothetical protein